jgi:hypothetical protein
MQSSLHCSVTHMFYWQFVYDLYGALHRDFDLLIYSAKKHSMT